MVISIMIWALLILLITAIMIPVLFIETVIWTAVLTVVFSIISLLNWLSKPFMKLWRKE